MSTESLSIDARSQYLRHVVFVSFYHKTSIPFRQLLHDKFQSLGKDCGGEYAGILFYEAGWNDDQSKDIHIVEHVVFRDKAALDAFRAHPKHKELTDILKETANWWVGDFPTDKIQM